MQFINTYQRLYRAVTDARNQGNETEPAQEYLDPLYDQMTSVRLISQQATQDQAKRAMVALEAYTYQGGKWPEVDKFFDRYLGAVREEFHLPPIDLVEGGPF